MQENPSKISAVRNVSISEKILFDFFRIRNQERRTKRGGQPPATFAKSEGHCPKDSGPQPPTRQLLRGTLDHSPACATFPKDEIRREHIHNDLKIIKDKRTLAKKGTPRGS